MMVSAISATSSSSGSPEPTSMPCPTCAWVSTTARSATLTALLVQDVVGDRELADVV